MLCYIVRGRYLLKIPTPDSFLEYENTLDIKEGANLVLVNLYNKLVAFCKVILASSINSSTIS